MKLPSKKPSAKSAALADLNSAINDGMISRLKAKKAKALDHTKATAMEPDTQMGEQGEAADEDDPIVAKRKAHFGARK